MEPSERERRCREATPKQRLDAYLRFMASPLFVILRALTIPVGGWMGWRRWPEDERRGLLS